METDWTLFCVCDDGGVIRYRNTSDTFDLLMPSGQIIAVPEKIISELGDHLGEACQSCSSGKLEWLNVNNLSALGLFCGTCDRAHVLADGVMCLAD